ncbi:MAG TPA: hypothetical protein VL400_22565 [Polyangiaceae bacterium]|nr:hypothetical protein [Polyangiaceae bacterium]
MALRVATSLDADGTPVMSEAATDGESPALTTTRFEILFDRYLDPRTAIRQAVCIRSDTAPVAGFDSCAGGIFLRPTYDPVTRVVTYYQENDSVELAPDTVYAVTVLRPRDGGDVGIRAFDGAALEASRTFLLRTAAAPAGTKTDAPPEADLTMCADDKTGVVGVLVPCAGGSCHGNSLASAAMELSLGTRRGIETTALKAAKETQMGANADQPAVNPVRFGADMPIIAPNDAGSSYLLYKILARTPVDADTLADGETDRLLGGIVIGAPMPLGKGYDPLAEDDVKLLSQWIQRGAVCAPTE